MTDIASRVPLSLSGSHRRLRDSAAAGAIAELDRAVEGIPHVVQAHWLFREPDYKFYVAARSTQHYQQLDEQLSRVPGVRRLTSSLAMKTAVEHHARSERSRVTHGPTPCTVHTAPRQLGQERPEVAPRVLIAWPHRSSKTTSKGRQ